MNTNTAVIKLNQRGEFLAANPEIRAVQEAYFAKLNPILRDIMEAVKDVETSWVRAVKGMREAGQLTLAFLADAKIPGGKLTKDFYLQMAGPGRKELQGSFELLLFCQRVASDQNLPKNFTMADALPYKQPLLSLLGIRSGHGDQYAVDAPSDWQVIVAEMKRQSVEAHWRQVKDDLNYFPEGHLAEHWREMFRNVWADKLDARIAALSELRDELNRDL